MSQAGARLWVVVAVTLCAEKFKRKFSKSVEWKFLHSHTHKHTIEQCVCVVCIHTTQANTQMLKSMQNLFTYLMRNHKDALLFVFFFCFSFLHIFEISSVFRISAGNTTDIIYAYVCVYRSVLKYGISVQVGCATKLFENFNICKWH